jgi:cephalosporin hydroxylase
MRRAARAVLPESAQDWLRQRRNPRQLIARMPRLSRRLDRWAATWTLDALVVRTDDARNVTWLDRPIWQYPMDAWVLQEMISSLRPELIVETGTHRGGSAYFFASLFDLLGSDGEVISIDIAAEETVPHPRVTYIEGSSVDPEVFAEVSRRAEATETGNVLVILDSDHHAEHVLAEIELYSRLVPIGGYVHVQDGCVDELPIFRGHFPGPAVAARQFLEGEPGFVRDLEIEQRYLMTTHPFGWLRRVS